MLLWGTRESKGRGWMKIRNCKWWGRESRRGEGVDESYELCPGIRGRSLGLDEG